MKITQWAGNYWLRLTGTLGAIVAFIGALTRVEWLARVIQSSVPVQEFPIKSGHYLINNSAAWCFAAGSILISVLVIASVYLSWIFLRHPSSAAIKRQIDQLKEAHKKSVDQSAFIVNRMYPTPENFPHKLIKGKYTLTIDRDGTGSYRGEEVIAAADPTRPLHFWKLNVFTEAEAPGFETLQEIDFRVKSKTNDVGYLLLENKLHSKRVAIFPLPSMFGGEADRREFETSYCWPRMLTRLISSGEEDWRGTLSSSPQAPVEYFEYSFYYHPDLGRIKCEYRGQALGSAVELKEVKTEQGWPGWRLSATGVPGGGVEYAFRLWRVSQHEGTH